MTNAKGILSRVSPLLVAIIFVAALAATILPWSSADAALISNRSLLVSSSQPGDITPDVSAGPGSPTNGQRVTHQYTFTAATTQAVQSIVFTACTNAGGYTVLANCGTITGFSAASWNGASVNVQRWDSGSDPDSGSADETLAFTVTASGQTWSLSNSSGGLDLAAGDIVRVTFTAGNTNYFVNPSSSYAPDASGRRSYFVNMSTYASSSVTAYNAGAVIDDGTVASSIADTINITTKVQETLRFSVEGATLTDDQGGANNGPSAISSPTASGATCEPLDPVAHTTSIRIGDSNGALAVARSYHGASYFRLATNSTSGAIVYYSGSVPRSGVNTIDRIGVTPNTATASTPGTEQFGLAFDDTTQGHNSLTYLVPVAAYGGLNDGASQFAFSSYGASLADDTLSPVKLAESTGIVSCDTGAIRYVANMGNDTEAGIYTTSINYIASPAY